MEMDKIQLQAWASRLNLTKPDEKEEYILTKEDEDVVLFHAIEQSKKHKAWKMAGMGLNEGAILAKLSTVDWDKEINRSEILDRANSSKHYDIWIKNKREKEKADEEKIATETRKTCNARFMFNTMAYNSVNKFGKEFIANDENKYFIKVLCYFFSGDFRFETELGFSFRKGLLIRGVSGLGKTYLINCIKDNVLNPVKTYSMIEITDEIKNNGAFNVFTDKIIYLDDVGTEEHTVNHYGTKINWFKDFIELYYSKNKPFNKLMISTNNSFQELEDKYGFRVRSRIKDMFNVIDVKGTDLRG